jgi:hypothetical protein
MPLISDTEALVRKLETLGKNYLEQLCKVKGLKPASTVPNCVNQLFKQGLTHKELDSFIKAQYQLQVQARESLISTAELRQELERVGTFSWGVIQGGLDNKIQTEFVRRYARYNELLTAVKARLLDDVSFYVICTWYNHWTTVLIEEQIALHPQVIPALKKVKGIDLFFYNQPFDLKVTYLPSAYSYKDAVKDPKGLIVWLYENQGAQRFGAHNRLYIVLHNPQRPEESWKLKRDYDLIKAHTDAFFQRETVSLADEVVFTFGRNTYTAISKLLLITP